MLSLKLKKSIHVFSKNLGYLTIPFILILCSFNTASAQKITTFQKSFGGVSDEIGCSVVPLPDKGFIIGGTTKSFGAGGSDILIVRTDSLGKKIWAKTYGGGNDEGTGSFPFSASVDMILTPDSNVVVLSTTASYGKGGNDVYFFKIGLNGNVKWSKTYGGTSNDFGLGIYNDPNGGYLITGETYSYGAGNGDILLMKTDTGGSIIWAKAYGNAANEEAGYEIRSTRDGDFLVCGYSNIPGSAYNEMIMKIDKSGNLIFNKVYGTSNYDDVLSVVEGTDSSIYLSGFTYNFFNSANTVAMFSRCDKNGNLKWAYIYDKNAHTAIGKAFYDFSRKTFDCFVVETDNGRIGMLNFDASGKIVKMKNYGPLIAGKYYTDGHGEDLVQIPSGGFALSYSSNAFGNNGLDNFFVKVNANASNPDSCNISQVALSPYDFTSYINDYTYSFTTTNFTPSVGNGIKTSNAAIHDTLICSPFVTNFSWKISCNNRSTPFFDSSYYSPTSWNWNFGDPGSSSNTSSSQNPMHMYATSGTYTVKLVSGNGSIKDSITHIVTVLQNHSRFKSNTITFCPGDSINLKATGESGVAFAWSPGYLLNDSTDSSVWAHPLYTTTFVVNVTDSAGCTETDSILVTEAHLPPISLGNNKKSCTKPIELSPGTYNGVSFLWSTGSTGDSINVYQSGKYWLTINKNGCTASDTVMVTFLDPAKFVNDSLHNELFCSDDSLLTLNAGIAYKYLWSPGGDTTQRIQVSASGSYTVTITASDGCTATKTAFITDQCSPVLFVPNAFTPNGNGLNDIFKPVSFWPLESYNMQIYNRWGERIFESDDINIGWNGTFTKGWDGIYKEPRCPEDVYLYIILYKFPYEVEQIKSGTVTLLR